MSYTGAHGEVLLKRAAMGIAHELGADFLSVHVGDLLETVSLLNAEVKALGRSNLTEDGSLTVPEECRLLADIMRIGNEGFLPSRPELRNMISTRPVASALDFIDFCLGSREEAAPLRIIFVHDNDRNVIQNGFLRAELSEMLNQRRLQERGQTLFILSEGSKYDISSTEKSTGPDENLRALIDPHNTSSANIPTNDANTTEFSFSWMIDGKFKAPRIVLSPPEDPKTANQHRKQIDLDRSDMLFSDNYGDIIGRIKECSTSEPLLYELLQSLPPVGDAGLIKRLLPTSLSTRRMAPSEVTLFCLSIPLETDRLSSDPVGLFAQSLESFLRLRNSQLKTIPGLRGPLLTGHSNGEALKVDDLNKYEKRFIPCIVTPSMVQTRFEDIGALDGVKRTLYELISLRLERPDYFTRGILRDSVSGILLFGPPGTGKTMLARAVAAQSGANFISVNSSSIFDMYVGEGEKNTKALFTLARKIAPCIIFVDEVDALLDSRSNSIGRASRVEIINEFMAEWDGLLSQNQGITVMAATNRPFALDDAVLRRLPRRILVDLPDAPAREQILQLLLRDDTLSATVSLSELAVRCEHYSGSDLKNMCMAAAMRALRRVRNDNNDGCQMEITKEDLFEALGDVPSSISDRMSTLQELREWDRTFGEGRVQKLSNNVRFGFCK